MKHMKKRNILLILVALIFIICVICTIWGNTALELNTYTIESEKLPKSFDGYKIAHVSDLHNNEMGEHNENLIAMLKDSSPDIIAITGDIVDSRNTDIEIALQFANEAEKIAPCYYITGNHEARVSEYESLKKGLIEIGVTVLEDKSISLEKSGEDITLMGVDDPSFITDYLLVDDGEVMQDKLSELKSEDSYTILLSHRPELFKIYAENDIDLVLSGHAHGGQFRLPFVDGLYAPHQGLFPKYDSGLYTEENTNMIVSRGIGNSLFPFRFNNRPEVILVKLKKT